MKSFLGASVVIGFAAVTFAACGGNNSDQNAKYPAGESRAMNELTPSERKEAERRANQEHERERELAAAREPGSSSPSSHTPKEVSRTSTALAVSSVATARCDRELKCKNIGTNQKYLSTDECITKLQNDKRTSLNPQECPEGVSDKDLASCLKSIREEDCGNPLDSVSRLTACRAGALCLK
ncbi:MAG TPA: DUF6184 family natural product biosynthesis lipoprotein [Polyangiaceae bacterium]|nr:DUF6184 family natural product biosynthesis lipoprotein [Polyangiaceae bacterium]